MGKHIIEIAPNNAIYIDSYRVVGDKPWGLFETRRITVSEYDLKEIVKRCNEVIKDEPNSSEKPNNSTISKMEQVGKPQADCGDFADRLAYERGVKHAWEVAQKVFNSTVTFYEAEDVAKQIDKDINVRSKDEPQTDFLTFLYNVINPNEMEEYRAMYEAKGIATKDEPQTDCAWR